MSTDRYRQAPQTWGGLVESRFDSNFLGQLYALWSGNMPIDRLSLLLECRLFCPLRRSPYSLMSDQTLTFISRGTAVVDDGHPRFRTPLAAPKLQSCRTTTPHAIACAHRGSFKSQIQPHFASSKTRPFQPLRQPNTRLPHCDECQKVYS
jgi:hypothetical protein